MSSNVPAIINNIQQCDYETLLKFGNENVNKINQISSSVINSVSNSDLGSIGEKISAFTVISKTTSNKFREFNSGVSKLNKLKKIPIINLFVGKYDVMVAKMATYVQSTRQQLDDIIIDLDRRIQSSISAISALSKFRDENDEIYKVLEANEEAFAACVRYLKQEKEGCIRSAMDVYEKDKKLDNINMRIQILEQKLKAVAVNKSMIILSNKKIATMSRDCISAINEFDTHKSYSIPSWMRLCTEQVFALQTKKDIEFIKSIRELTENILVDSTKTFAINTVEIQKELEKGMCSIDAIEEATNLMNQALQEKQRIIDESASVDDLKKRLEQNNTTLLTIK